MQHVVEKFIANYFLKVASLKLIQHYHSKHDQSGSAFYDY